ncbi:MAG: UDP-glucose 4-epimerase [Alphaproteobacteria bacterium 41-28]|nr:MAG: UDP-glucose 4-epimerase [Alphaproteobacteria bacterium 41-28]
MFENKTILITGGTGSFGNAVMNRLVTSDIKEIRIFSRDEKKQEDMRLAYNNPKIKFYIGDVRNYSSIFGAMKGVNYIFHAAALKQVPSCEFYPMEAVQTNILGAENVLNAAIANNVERVIVLSTDKAVYPINAMGLSKAMMEKLMLAKARMQQEGDTILCATRYGNVMGSRGSVIPLFLKQIKEGKPLTITEPTMTRFLMSLEDSVDLVLHAFLHGRQGDIFVQKAPAATIAVLAQALKELFERKNVIHFIGTRHGEKLYESLVSSEEMAKADDIGEFYRIPLDNRDLNYAKFFVIGEKSRVSVEDYTSHNTVRLDVEGVKNLLSKLDFIQEQLNITTKPTEAGMVAA